jgi:tetratricopeptide (TPR) repeat protein
MSLTNTHDAARERGRLCVVIATIVINVIAVSLLTFAPWSDWRTGAALNFVDNCLLVGFVVVRRDALLARFLLFGVVVGLTELAADAWLVDYTRTHDYSIGGGPMIWRSPLWMPLAWEAALLRANINARLGKYAEALREFDYLISLYPRNVTLARALSDPAWFRATCPNASFRNEQQAVKDAKAACSIMIWKDEHMIDTLAVAYAETGDFNSAVQYAAQALAVKGVSPDSTKLFQQHLALFQQRMPIRL